MFRAGLRSKIFIVGGVYPILPIDSFISPPYESGNNSNFLKLLNKEGREYFLEGPGDGNDALLYSALFWIHMESVQMVLGRSHLR